MNKREKVKKPEGSKTHRFLWIGLLIFIALIFACVGFSYRSIRQKLNGVADAAMMETADENAAMLQMTLESRFELMDDVGRKIAEGPESAQDILTYLGEYANGYGFKRLCYMDATGWTTCSPLACSPSWVSTSCALSGPSAIFLPTSSISSKRLSSVI